MRQTDGDHALYQIEPRIKIWF